MGSLSWGVGGNAFGFDAVELFFAVRFIMNQVCPGGAAPLRTLYAGSSTPRGTSNVDRFLHAR